MSGFIALHREAVEHHLFVGDSAKLGAWLWLVAKACWRPTRFNVAGKTINLERGQFCCSVRDLAEAWGWSKSSVDRFLTRLKTETMIETDAGTGRLVVTICNYAKYQDMPDDAGTAVGTPRGTAAGQQRDIKEQGNKVTIEEEPIGSSPPLPPKPAKRTSGPDKIGMSPEWLPGPLPTSVRALTDQWPPGRLEREVEQFRDYWLDRPDKRPGWDRTFHNRIRDIHDRVLRDTRNGNRTSSFQKPDRRDGATKAWHRRLEPGDSGDPPEADRRRDDEEPRGVGLLPAPGAAAVQ